MGWFIGSAINLGLIEAGHTLIPIEGLDPNDMNALAKVMPALSAKYFILDSLFMVLRVSIIVTGKLLAL